MQDIHPHLYMEKAPVHPNRMAPAVRMAVWGPPRAPHDPSMPVKHGSPLNVARSHGFYIGLNGLNCSIDIIKK